MTNSFEFLRKREVLPSLELGTGVGQQPPPPPSVILLFILVLSLGPWYGWEQSYTNILVITYFYIYNVFFTFPLQIVYYFSEIFAQVVQKGQNAVWCLSAGEYIVSGTAPAHKWHYVYSQPIIENYIPVPVLFHCCPCLHSEDKCARCNVPAGI